MSVHDFSIMDALMDYAEGKSFVAICGGHAILRNSREYRDVMELGNRIANAGFITVSGGGPGAMEASNLGAYIAGLKHYQHQHHHNCNNNNNSNNNNQKLDSIHETTETTNESESKIDNNNNNDNDNNNNTIENITKSSSFSKYQREKCNHDDLQRAFEIISSFPQIPGRPEFENVLPAKAVIEEFGPTKCYTPSLGIPTWRYGHEPPNLFTAYHAKFFQNSVREAVLLDICYGGLILTPGGPGTVQEIFQAACRCAYAQDGYEYPIVFYGIEYWTNSGIWDLIKRQSIGRKYHQYLLLSDSIEEIMDHLVKCAEEKGLNLIDDFNQLDNPYWYSKHGESARLSTSSQNSFY
eukprot:CAMPEP_0174818420 /NCGR_PEP_ID=MMETSP1107-20130205/1090_1 /TAXON_ID=36770 /ORGANISM="Paraphysomonas vestita, Strain GFlagA" /LENGTH=351 /DNA_ID=CAMNT_0016030227 /DNA_START=486 /DNA_END=1541 /DNA_ORIENTATION=+